MRGPRCQANNPDNPRFCKECGVRLALACSQCGSEISPGNPGPAHAQDRLGDVSYDRDQLDDVLSENNEALRVDPSHSGALRRLAAPQRCCAATARWSPLTAGRRR
jgi:Double zinc ribbon